MLLLKLNSDRIGTKLDIIVYNNRGLIFNRQCQRNSYVWIKNIFSLTKLIELFQRNKF